MRQVFCEGALVMACAVLWRCRNCRIHHHHHHCHHCINRSWSDENNTALIEGGVMKGSLLSRSWINEKNSFCIPPPYAATVRGVG